MSWPPGKTSIRNRPPLISSTTFASFWAAPCSMSSVVGQAVAMRHWTLGCAMTFGASRIATAVTPANVPPVRAMKSRRAVVTLPPNLCSCSRDYESMWASPGWAGVSSRPDASCVSSPRGAASGDAARVCGPRMRVKRRSHLTKCHSPPSELDFFFRGRRDWSDSRVQEDFMGQRHVRGMAGVWVLLAAVALGLAPAAQASSVTATSWIELDGSGTHDGLSRSAIGVRILERNVAVAVDPDGGPVVAYVAAPSGNVIVTQLIFGAWQQLGTPPGQGVTPRGEGQTGGAGQR